MYSPRPYGISVKNGELTAQDKVYIDAVVRRFSNFKETSNLASLRNCYDLPDGGGLIVQDMGGVLRVIADKNPIKNTLADEPNKEVYIPMLFCGGINNTHVSNGKVQLKISSATQKRLVHYNEDAELPPEQIELGRFNIRANNSIVPEFYKYSTQYEAQRPTWYSGSMAEVMQIVGGYGKQPTNVDFKDASFENIQMQFTTTVFNAMQKEIAETILPGYTGKPNKDGEFQYDYKFSKTHAVGFNEDGEPWLLQVSQDGLYAMPLPVIPETTTKTFKQYITNKDDTELKMIVEKFGGMPSGESFPSNMSEFEAWRKAGVIIKLCDMQPFYDNKEYSEVCGWSFNSNASEGFNTCYTYDADNLMIGLAYKLIITLGKSIYTNGVATKTEIPTENAGAVDAYLSQIIPLLSDYDENKSKAIRFKLRRSPDLLIERAGGVFSSDEIFYWDDLELDPIADSSAILRKVSEGYLMFDSNRSLIGEWRTEINNMENYGLASEISNPQEYMNSLYSYIYSYFKRLGNTFNYDAQINSSAYNLDAYMADIENRYFQPIMRFPKLGSSNSNEFSYFEIQKASSDESKRKNCDTTIFGYYVGDKLKLVNYYYNFRRESKYVDYSKLDMSEIKFPVGYKDYTSGEKNLFAFKHIDENPSAISTEAIENTGNSPRGYFYTSDFDKRSYDDYFWKFSYNLAIKRGPTSESILDGQYISSLPNNDLKLVSNLEKNISFTVPYFSRNNPLLNTEKYSEFKFLIQGGRNYYQKLDKKWYIAAYADLRFPTVYEYVGVGIRNDYGYSYASYGTRFEYEEYQLSPNSWLLGYAYDANTFGTNLLGMQVFDDFDNQDEVVNYMNQNYPGAYDSNAKQNRFLQDYQQSTGTFETQNPNLFRYSLPSEMINYDYNADFSEYVRDFFNAEGIYNESSVSNIPTDNFTIAPVGSTGISKGIKYPNVEKCTLYGTVLGDAIEIRDLTDRDTYFNKDAYLNYTQSTFGERQYATIGLSDDVADVVAYGSTKFRSDGDDVCFIGVINE